MQQQTLEIMDKVRVIKETDDGNGKTKHSTVHNGVVVGLTTTHARVYRPKMNDEDTAGDVEPSTSEWFPIKGKKMWIVNS